MSEQKITLKFKRSLELDQIQDSTGFMWLPGHAREVDPGLGQQLLKNFPKNFDNVTPKPIMPDKQTPLGGTFKENAVEMAPDKMIDEDKPGTKKKGKK